MVLTQSTNRVSDICTCVVLCEAIYEPPLNPDMVLKAGETSVQEYVEKVYSEPTGWEGMYVVYVYTCTCGCVWEY